MKAANFLLMFYGTFLVLSFGFEKLHGQSVGKSSFFIFGDSTVDVGNNNNINTIPENQANYKPYGCNGYFENPTGRFSDGRIIVDFIAEYANLPLIPPFLPSSTVDYVNGVNFASGGAGVLSETNQDLVVDLKTQIKHFEKVEKSLSEKLGETQAKQVLSEAVYFISVGSNDYMGGYLGNPKVREMHNPEEYVGMVIRNLTNAVQELYVKGGRKFAFLSLSPLGCLPALRALNSKDNEDGCLEDASGLAFAHNHALISVLNTLEVMLQGFKYSNSNFYNWLEDRIKHPFDYGFKEGKNACCGTGSYGGVFTCGGTKMLKEYHLCDNVDDHVWWDSFHPTEKVHEQIAIELWNGSSDSVGPYNLQQLFSYKEKNNIIADIVDDPDLTQIF